MSRVEALIFGGTSEGRELAEYASVHRVPVLVSVVSEYGEDLLFEDACVRVRRGALSPEAMEALLLKEMPRLVLDATHPYAKVVTGQVKALCEKLSISYRRVIREEGTGGDILTVPSPEAAAELLKEDRACVLLTTGSKELEVFAKKDYLAGRIFARVLPVSGVLEKCERLGISGSHIIAMQGPFSEEMNRAILRRTEAKWLVTKESGSRGGFSEKVNAARDCGCRVIVIERPEKEEGISLAEAKALLADGEEAGKAAAGTGGKAAGHASGDAGGRCISLIGMGMGGGGQLTLETVEVLKHCDAVLGASRMLADVDAWCSRARKEPIYLADRIVEWLAAHPGYRNVAVVYSGDTGFYSGSSSLVRALRECGGDWQVQVYPGISSVGSLCARMQDTWEGMYLASAHGRSCDVTELVRCHPSVFLLLGGTENLQSVCRKLTEAGYGDTKVTAGVRMGYPDEELIRASAAELLDAEADDLTAVVLKRHTKD